MKKKFLLLSKIIGLALFYTLVLVASTFLTMSALIKGEEIKTPDLYQKNLKDAYRVAYENGFYLKPITGNYGKQFKPLTIINQFPAPGVKIKEKSYVQVFVASEVVEVLMPDLAGYSLRESQKILRDNDLRKRYVSYMGSNTAAVDVVLSQSVPAGARVPAETEVDILVSKGRPDASFIMPDIIGRRIEQVEAYFDSKGLKISENTTMSYPGLEPGVIVFQYPSSGFQINAKARIRVKVSE